MKIKKESRVHELHKKAAHLMGCAMALEIRNFENTAKLFFREAAVFEQQAADLLPDGAADGGKTKAILQGSADSLRRWGEG